MNRNSFYLIFILTIFFSLVLVSAEVTETNTIRYATLDLNGTATLTSTPITNSNALGFICSDSTCSSFSNNLWNGSIINSGSSSSLNLVYPTSLSGAAYAIYFFKEGYIPYEVVSNWAGTGNVYETRYLTQKTLCNSNIYLDSFTILNNTLKINVSIDSPIENSGLLDITPSSLSSYYSTDLKVNANIVGNTNYSSSNTVKIPFSSTKSSSLYFELAEGNYSISIYAENNDSKCLSLTSNNILNNFTIINSTIPITPPINNTNETNQTIPSISNLTLIDKTNTSLSWSWINPNSVNFSEAIIYFDNSNVLNTSSNNYTANGLLPNSTHTISILTKDIFGKINTSEVSDTQTTLPNAIIPPTNITNSTNVTDTTPPASISNLSLDSATNTSLSWSWINPSDPDFLQAIVYLDGINVLNTSSNGFGYLSFLPNTTHTISILTMDNSTNINTTAVSRTDSTLANPPIVIPPVNPPSNGGGGGGSSINHITDLNKTLEPKKRSIIMEEESQNNTILTPVTKQTSALTLTWVLLLLGALFLLILIFAALMLTSGRNR